MSTAHEFDKGVEIPTASTRTGVNVDLLRAMPVNTSKWFSTKEVKKATRFYRVAKKLGITIIIRKVTKEDPRGAGVRMWRTGDRDVALDPIAAAERKATKRPARKTAKPKAKPKAKAKARPKKAAKKRKPKSNSTAVAAE